MEPAKRARKANWTELEVDELRDSYLEFRSVVDGRLGIGLTNADKDRAWKTIQERYNKTFMRERRQQSQQTGGGPAPSLTRTDEKMIEAIGEVAVSGFKGIDTFSESKATDVPIASTTGPPSLPVQHVYTATPVTVSAPFGCDKNRKRKAESDDDTKTVISLLQNILEEQQKTNQILSQLFAINVEP